MQKTAKEYLLKRLNSLYTSSTEADCKKKNLTDENTQKILKLKDKYHNKRCFIVGSSPSLNLLDLTKLNNEYIFTVNRGYKLKDKGLNHSTFHIMSDNKTFTEDNVQNEIPKDFAENFLIYAAIDFPFNDNVLYFDFVFQSLMPELKFQEDFTKILISYGTVVHYAIQAAYFMGFKDIYIIGVDLDFKQNKGHAYKETQGENRRQLQYSVNGADLMLKGIEYATAFLKNKNVNLFNASPAGILDCMPRVKYEDLFRGGNDD